jgi:nitrogen fixation protein FixH
MKERKHETSYWPHMILGFLLIGITLGYWTVKSASSLPVSEENAFMMKYQKADKDINNIIEAQQRFDARYTIKAEGDRIVVPVKNSKAVKEESAIVLHNGANRFVFHITDKAGNAVDDMNVSFLLTRPHTVADDQRIENIPFKYGAYKVEEINISKPGRYILELRAQKGDAIGYYKTPAYLEP